MKEFIPFFITLSLVLLIIDIIVLNAWAQYVKRRKFNPLFYKVPWILAVLMVIIGTFNNFSRLLYPEPMVWTVGLFILSSIWYIPKFPIAIIIMIKHLVNLIKRIITFFKNKKTPVTNDSTNDSRRKFASDIAWAAAGIPFVITGYGALVGAYNYKVHTAELFIQNLDKSLDGLRIVQISDLHLGSFYSLSPLRKTIGIINELKADLVLITGDFVNFDPREYAEAPNLIKQIRADLGVYGCLGNHDHYMSLENHRNLISLIQNSNVNLLINQSETLTINNTKINIAGTDNYGMNQHFGDFRKTLSQTDPEAITILMSHDPTNWDRFILGKEKVELMLSGHTHGGQFALQLPGMKLAPAKLVYKQWAGLYEANNQFLYINRGLGLTGPPIRVGMDPEITEIILRA